jgi:hypothetical protein
VTRKVVCAHFRTDATFLEVHRAELRDTERVIAKADANGWVRQSEMNERNEQASSTSSRHRRQAMVRNLEGLKRSARSAQRPSDKARHGSGPADAVGESGDQIPQRSLRVRKYRRPGSAERSPILTKLQENAVRCIFSQTYDPRPDREALRLRSRLQTRPANSATKYHQRCGSSGPTKNHADSVISAARDEHLDRVGSRWTVVAAGILSAARIE